MHFGGPRAFLGEGRRRHREHLLGFLPVFQILRFVNHGPAAFGTAHPRQIGCVEVIGPRWPVRDDERIVQRHLRQEEGFLRSDQCGEGEEKELLHAGNGVRHHPADQARSNPVITRLGKIRTRRKKPAPAAKTTHSLPKCPHSPTKSAHLPGKNAHQAEKARTRLQNIRTHREKARTHSQKARTKGNKLRAATKRRGGCIFIASNRTRACSPRCRGRLRPGDRRKRRSDRKW